VTVGGRTKHLTFEDRDQVAPELIELSRCVLENREPEPSGYEGLLDVRVIEALQASARSKKPVRLSRAHRRVRMTANRAHHIAPVREPRLVKAASPDRD
jgi:hypothetical protein